VAWWKGGETSRLKAFGRMRQNKETLNPPQWPRCCDAQVKGKSFGQAARKKQVGRRNGKESSWMPGEVRLPNPPGQRSQDGLVRGVLEEKRKKAGRRGEKKERKKKYRTKVSS